MNEDDVKNCKGCRVNMYWAFQHYEELASLRQANKLPPRPESASFLVETSKKIDDGPTVDWLHKTIKKFGFKYTTYSGVTWGIDDVRTPAGKNKVIQDSSWFKFRGIDPTI